MKIRIILCQKPLGEPITRSDVESMKRFSPHFICYPEYFFVKKSLGTQVQTPHNQARQLQRLAVLSRELATVVVGGTMPELADGTVYNTSFVFHGGRMLGRYRKKRLFFAEVGKITPGEEYRVFEAHGITFGILICADVFDDGGFHFMKERGARLIFSPTFSPRKEESAEEKFARDRDIYVRGAGLSGAVIAKVCGVKSEFRNFLQARSLIADGHDVIFRVMPDEEEREMLIMREIEV